MASELAGDLAGEAARGSFYLTVGQLFTLLFGAVSVFIIARMLGPEGYGLYSLALIPASLLVLGTQWGLNIALVKYSSEARERGDTAAACSAFRCSLAFRIVAGSMGTGLCLIFSKQLALWLLNRPEASGLVKIASALILAQAVFSTAYIGFVGLGKAEGSAIANLIQSASRLILAPLLIILFSTAGAVAGHVASYVIGAIAALIGVIRVMPGEGCSFSHELLRSMLAYGLPVYAANLLLSFSSSYPSIVLAWFRGDFEVGNFSAAVKLIYFLSAVAMSFSLAMLSAFSRASAGGKAEAVYGYSVKYLTLILLPLVVCTSAGSRLLVNLIYGREYTLAPRVLSIYSLAYMLVGLGYLVNQSYFNGKGETREVFWMSLASLAVLAPAAPLLAKLWGAAGVALSFVASQAASCLVGFKRATGKYGAVWLKGEVARAYATAILAAPLAIAAYLNMLLGYVLLPLYLLAYLTLLPLMKAINGRDIEVMETATETLPVSWAVRPLLRYLSWILKRISS